MHRRRHIKILHPVELITISICDAQVPIVLRVAIAELAADVGDVVAFVIVPNIQHEVEDIVVYDTISESFQ